MSTQSLAPLVVVGTVSGNSPEIRSYPEAASQTFKKGEAVYIDGSGNVAEFTSSVDNDSQRFLGFAAVDAHNDGTAGTHDIPVNIANDDTVFEANLYHATQASAITAKTDVGTLLPLAQLPSQGSGIVTIDKGNTAGQIDCARILTIVQSPSQLVGDIYGRVRFVVEAVARQFRQ